MKIFDVFETKTLDWSNESCDVWIDPNGKVYDLGHESCHLQYIRENIDDKKYTIDLIENGWIKITNTKNKVSITALSNSLGQHKKLYIPVILEKAKMQRFELDISIINQAKNVTLSMPKEATKFVSLM